VRLCPLPVQAGTGRYRLMPVCRPGLACRPSSNCFSQASQAGFYKPGRILQAQTSALAGGRGLEPSKIRFPNSCMPNAAIHFIQIGDSSDPDSIPNRFRFLSAETKRIGIARRRFCRNIPNTCLVFLPSKLSPIEPFVPVLTVHHHSTLMPSDRNAGKTWAKRARLQPAAAKTRRPNQR
jgi:hypothetical protein